MAAVLDEETLLLGFLSRVSACAVVVVGEDGAIATVNRRTEALFGYESDELLGKPVEVLIPEAQRGGHARQRDAFRAEARPRPMGTGRDLTGRRKDGSQVPVEIALDPFTADGKRFVAAYILDISRRRNLEAGKDEAVSLASHEIRAPITSIGLALSMMSKDMADQVPENLRRILAIADRECRRLRRLVDDYLNLTKLEAGGVPFDMRRLMLGPVVRRAVEAAGALGAPRGVRLTFDDRAPGAAAFIDADRLVQAVTNLLSNAVKFSPRDATVSVALEERGAVLRVSVADQGPGIPAEFRPRIFSKFAQAQGTAPADPREKGTGLGLSLVKAVAERLGGRAGFDSEPGKGSTFYIELPKA
ncbi:MAG: PAS domain S-box protein [Elusimicrobia bacterium]|nr:PAS domain S-box protein [Elusimicrobiota bacterium]